MKTTIILALLLLLPAAAACHDQFGAIRLRDAGKTYYFPVQDVADVAPVPEGLWEETNGLDGFQCAPTTLPDGRTVPADTRIF